MFRSKAMVRKLGGILGKFEEMDTNEANRNERFLRLKVTMDLKLSLKRGTVVRFKDKNLRVHFKYERLPTFCFVCGRLGHQLKDCEASGDLNDKGFKDIEENDLLYGQWLRASPLPRVNEDVRKKESDSSSCSRSLFNHSSGLSKCEVKGKEKECKGEVEQINNNREENLQVPMAIIHEANANPVNILEIEAVAESFGAANIFNVGTGKVISTNRQGGRTPRKLNRRPNRKLKVK